MASTLTKLDEITAGPPERDSRLVSSLIRIKREPVVDLVRAVSLVAVVLIHLFMAGVIQVNGEIVFGNVVEGQAWWPPVTWLIQIMPMFFIAGGYAAAAAWTRLEDHGGTPFDFVRSRLHRLVPSALALVALLGVLFVGLRFAGVPEELLVSGGWWLARPLWFLAVYALINCLLAPYLYRWHIRRPRATLGALILAAIVVDVAVNVTGLGVVGMLNFVFVWAAIQQIGFWMHDEVFHRLSRPAAWGILAAAAAALALLIGRLGYPADLILSANVPANISLVVVGIAQVALLRLAYPHLTRIARHRRIIAVTNWLNTRSLSVYLWHLPVLGLILGLALTFGADMPNPFSGAWWQMRLQLLALSALVTFVLCNVLAPIEAFRPRAPHTVRFSSGGPQEIGWVALAVATTVAAVALLLGFGLGVPRATCAAVLLLAASLASSRRIGIHAV